jgi:hypothetical protein
MGQIAGKQVIQHADGAQLVGRDLARRREVVGHHAGPHPGLLRLGRGAARRLKEGVDLVLLERLLHGHPLSLVLLRRRSFPRLAPSWRIVIV